MKRFCAAMGFLTAFPLPRACRSNGEDLARSVPFFPLVGLVVGLSAAGMAILLDGVFPPIALSVILTGWLCAVQGGLHLDGLGDTSDGFFSWRDRDRILEIMRDSRIGVFGCISIMGVLALKASALASMPAEYRARAILLAPVAARCIMVPMLGFLPSARPDGIGRMFGEHRSVRESGYAMIFLMGAAWLTARFAGLTAAFIVITVIALFACVCMKKIGGITGDNLGAAGEITEAVILLVLCARPLGGLWG